MDASTERRMPGYRPYASRQRQRDMHAGGKPLRGATSFEPMILTAINPARTFEEFRLVRMAAVH